MDKLRTKTIPDPLSDPVHSNRGTPTKEQTIHTYSYGRKVLVVPYFTLLQLLSRTVDLHPPSTIAGRRERDAGDTDGDRNIAGAS